VLLLFHTAFIGVKLGQEDKSFESKGSMHYPN